MRKLEGIGRLKNLQLKLRRVSYEILCEERENVFIYEYNSKELILHSICGACLATGLQSRNSAELIAAVALYCALLTETIRARETNFRNVDCEVYFSVRLGLKSTVTDILGTPVASTGAFSHLFCTLHTSILVIASTSMSLTRPTARLL